MDDSPNLPGSQRNPPLRKSYGQHHLTRKSICTPLIEFLAPAGNRVVEIGPGGGILTERLVEAGAQVIAIEIDTAWAFKLIRQLDSVALEVVVADATRLRWEALSAGTLVAGNLPFNIATSLISQLLPCWRQIPRAGFLVQREVGERLMARPGDGAYGALSVLTAARARAAKLGRVSRGSFRPPPKVDGMFIGLDLVPPPLDDSQMQDFAGTVHLAFSQRRKQLRNSLAAGWGRDIARAALAASGIDPRLRPEELSLDDFLELHAAYLRSKSP